MFGDFYTIGVCGVCEGCVEYFVECHGEDVMKNNSVGTLKNHREDTIKDHRGRCTQAIL